MDIQIFTYGGWAWGIIHSEKNEKPQEHDPF